MSSPLPDYYGLLGVAPTATSQEVREAYKRASLQCHPDRFPNASAEEKQRLTTKFQSLADACEWACGCGCDRDVECRDASAC